MNPIRLRTTVMLPFLLISAISVSLWYVNLRNDKNPQYNVRTAAVSKNSSGNVENQMPTPSIIKAQIKQPGNEYAVSLPVQTFQTFNNCGPATLSMLLAYFGKPVSQDELGQALRPYQNPIGDNDDKSVTLDEIAVKAAEYNLVAYYRPNGNIEKLKLFLANDIPVITRTWLSSGEDIGHYRIVRGFDDKTQEFIQNDSYQGKNLRFAYKDFEALWQPFNYEYMVVVPQNKKDVAEAILGDEIDQKIAWQRANTRAHQELVENPDNVYLQFNLATSFYHLGEYQESVEAYEKAKDKLPSRMLWYQIQPIKAYKETGKYDQVFALTDSILNNQNRAFSELYIIRGESYKAQGQTDLAMQEFERAVFFNKNSKEAKIALEQI